jgi:hypothetical protein
MTLEFKRGEGIDQFSREQAAGPEVQAGPGVWEHRIIGLCSSAPGSLPRQGLVFMVRWPVQIKAGSRSDYAGLNFDIFPTFLELAGAKPAADLDAISQVPVLNGGTTAAPRDLYFVRREGGAACGGKSYEAIIRGDSKPMQNDPFSPRELYNLKTDPQEKTNLAATNKKMFNELSAALRLHIQRGGATPWQKPPAGRSP